MSAKAGSSFLSWCNEAVDSRLPGTPGLVAYRIVTDPDWPAKAHYWQTIQKHLRRAQAHPSAAQEVYILWCCFAQERGWSAQFIGGPLDGLRCYRVKPGPFSPRIISKQPSGCCIYVLEKKDGERRYTYQGHGAPTT